MGKENRLQFDIDVTPDELTVRARASYLLVEVASSAIDGVTGFEVKGIPSTPNYERYSIREICKCMGMLEDFCNPFGKLEGYFDKDSK